MKDILLVDDNRTILVYMSSVLKKRGYQVHTATGGEAALQMLADNNDIQLVLSDWMMPGMSGVELCSELKSKNYNRYIFFVLLSSKGDEASIINGIDAGADDFIDKKTSIDELDGDMLGYMQLDTDHVAFYLFDVAGHGVSSALMSFSVQTSLSVQNGSSSVVLKNDGDTSTVCAPADVVSKLNEMYMSSDANILYFTMIYAVLNVKTGLMSYCCAGHPPLVWYHGNQGNAELIGHDNFVVGAFDDVEYQAAQIQLEPGDKIWFYSDGITEADNGDEQYSEEGLRNAIEQLNQYPIQQQTELLVNNVRDWTKSDCFDDDVSVLVAEWKGPQEGDAQCDMKLVNKATAQFFK
ncbi:SpoIIE family protein phosphatase [Vibrio fortis]|uniref:SpoIIE family protein phosphatase n=1 Tax=Vibrio fortis TaxID=212667 RepID=UPI002F3F5DEF